MLTMSTFSLLHEKNNFASHAQFFVIINYYRFTYEIHKRLYVHPRAMHINAYNLYSVNFLNHRFHTIGRYVQNHRYRLSTDMANIGPIPIPIIGQSLLSFQNFGEKIACAVRYNRIQLYCNQSHCACDFFPKILER